MAFCRLRVSLMSLNGVAPVQPKLSTTLLHDLVGSSAVHRLISGHRDGADVQRLFAEAVYYLGHVHISGTQRYLTLTPELLREAGLAL